MTELRRVEVLKEGKWVQVRMKDLNVGDRFRLFENDNQTVSHEFATEWYVTESPKLIVNENKEETWSVETKPVIAAE